MDSGLIDDQRYTTDELTISIELLLFYSVILVSSCGSRK